MRSGDAWVEGPNGERMWGTFGAAGLLAVDAKQGVLMQHRAEWSHEGGTWGIPGGARDEHETAPEAALREANEEAAVPVEALDPRFTAVADLGFWQYTTLAADVVHPFTPEISDPESVALEWVPLDEVAALPLHSGFASAWPKLREWLRIRPQVVVDVANVMGSRPNGWWRDRAGAAGKLIDELAPLATHGIAAATLQLPSERWWPTIHFVVEGQAKTSAVLQRALPRRASIIAAPALGDDEIVAQTARLRAEHPQSPVYVATSDRELRARIEALGAERLSPRTLLQLAESQGHDHSTSSARA